MSPDAGRKTISYVFPIYNESGNIPTLYETISRTLSEVPYDAEIIFINDGSTDSSLELLSALQVRDSRILVVDFPRNYGHQVAVTAGLDIASGDAVVIMDSDLQDPPAVSLQLISQWEAGFDVVYAQRRTRKDSAFKRFTAWAFYLLLKRIASIDIPPNTGDFRLLDRAVVDEIKRYREHDRFIRGMVSYVGFRQTAVLFDRDARLAGQTGYPLRKMLKLAADGIFGFSTFPLTLISRVGIFTALLSILGVLYALFMKIFVPAAVVEGWTFIVISVLFVGGLQLMMLGILGGYIGRIYTEVQNRPLYAVRAVYGSRRRQPTLESAVAERKISDE
ncbi:glycosyltransferase family 2 protein [Psychromicrobium xiongbiense]|uniref:glycosyltransferase family 2 protein n=1 Tax=Psychromicrobium xiongbiense TaxID=3051184 RepID=UPI002552A71C|nr:glycosyltransferase family 2 protein [Psychromicrobium sp. YIM S02556]